MMELGTLTAENLGREHICCSLSDKKGEHCMAAKKEWLRERFADGLVFTRLDVRGKVFIEYIPADRAWCPIRADGYMHVNCLWVSGQYAGQGYADRLLDACVSDAKEKGMLGLTALSSEKKRPFLSDGDYLRHRGFRVADSAEPYFTLLYLPFAGDAPVPRFADCARAGTAEEQGLTLYYSNQCPFAKKYAMLFETAAGRHGRELRLVRFESAKQAQSAPAPFTTYSLFDGGRFVTHEILSEKKMEQYLSEGRLP